MGSLNARRFFLCEGVATGAAIREALGDETVIVCFDAGNLEPVACSLHFKYLDTDLVICSDNDLNKAGLRGAEKVSKSVKTVDVTIVLPAFAEVETYGAARIAAGETSKDPTDFNDLANLEGLEAVKRKILNAIKKERAPSPSSASPQPIVLNFNEGRPLCQIAL
jgi:putative DNA primase/helicase